MSVDAVNAMKLAHGAQFLDRVQYQLCSYAVTNVIGAGSPPSNQAARVALANRILADPGNFASKLAVSMVQDAGLRLTYQAGPPVDSSATDETIFAVVNALWDKWVDVI